MFEAAGDFGLNERALCVSSSFDPLYRRNEGTLECLQHC